MRILLVEDDRPVRVTVRDALEEAGHTVLAVADGQQALAAIDAESVDLLLTDVRLPHVDGLTLFARFREVQPDAAALVMTAYGRVEDAVEVMRRGAHDYITKPFDIDALLLRVERIAAERRLRAPSPEGGPSRAVEMVGDSPAIRRVLERVDAAAEADVNVLVMGETGTGKELCARALHERSPRTGRPFVHVNCAAIPGDLFEAEMFGHEAGAFTGALRRREGRLLAAHRGTLFLDEVGELRLDHQAKLLRAIELKCFEPVGSSRSVDVDVRFVGATNRDLRVDVERNVFRQDLFFRLNVIEIVVPPLRDRRGDIPLLVSSFLHRAVDRRGVPLPHLTPAAVAALLGYDYPGNVRELLHALEHGLALARGAAIDVAHLPAPFRGSMPGLLALEGFPNLPAAVRHFERLYIERVLEHVDGRRAEAARILGISRKNLWEKLKP